jgi:hypothetical protein
MVASEETVPANAGTAKYKRDRRVRDALNWVMPGVASGLGDQGITWLGGYVLPGFVGKLNN